MKKYHLIYFIFLFLQSQTIGQTFYFKNYQVNDGLSGNTITSIVQDQQGFMWMGSRNGLNRFDGKKFKVFKYKKEDKNSIGSSSILSLHMDEKGSLWVGTTRGIYLYNSRDETFSLIKNIPQEEVRNIKSAGDVLWIVVNFKLYQYDLKNNRSIYRKTASPVVAMSISKHNKSVLVATMDGRMFKIQAVSESVIQYDLTKFNGAGKLTQIQDIYSINDSAFLIGTFDRAFRADLKHKQLFNLFDKKPDLKNIQVHTFIAQNDSTYWIGSEKGIYVYNSNKKDFTHITKELNNPYSITDNVIQSFCLDNEGSVWVGTFFGGVNYFTRQFNNFKKNMPGVGKNTISGSLVHEICKDRYGDMWIGTEDKGLNKIDGRSGQVTSFSADGSPASISYNNIHGLVASGDELWIGTYEHGLDVMDIRTGKVIRHYKSGDKKYDLKGNFIVALYRTRSNQILIATWNGLFRYDRPNDRFIQLFPFNFQVQAIHEDRDGLLWLATYGNGAYTYDPITGKTKNFRNEANNKNSLPDNYVNGLYEDEARHLWFCTEGGLSKYDRNGTFTNYTMEEGLPENQVYRVLEDEMHQLWISSAKGLIKLDPTSGQMTLYRVNDGLPTEQFNYNSSFKDKDGTLYFGTINGMVSFKPSAFVKNSSIPPVFITDILINNKAQDIHPQGLLKHSILHTESINLPYDSTNITFDIAALSFVAPESNVYKYFMQGYDADWTKVAGNQSIHYNKLPPGNYKLRIQSGNSSGGWNPKETKLDIRIDPPLWASWWAYLLYSLIVITVAALILRYYYIANKAKNQQRLETFEREKEREMYNLKLDFFANVAHEIKTPLTLIKLPLDKMLDDEAEYSQEAVNHLQMMKKNTNRLIDLTQQLLNFRKVESEMFKLTFSKVDINELLSEVFHDFDEVAKEKNLDFDLILPRMSLTAVVDEEAIKKIFTNLISNATKYAAQKVTVKLLPFNSDDMMFNIEVNSDGNKIPSEQKDKIFEPFYRIKDNGKETGTGIGLSLAKSLAELHSGMLTLVPTMDDENLFLLSIPIIQESAIISTPVSKTKPEEHKIVSSAVVPTSMNEERISILLVEDNPEILDFLNRELGHHFNILTAGNGLQALEKLENNNTALIISDIMMPVMDGIELCRRVKSELAYNHIPIILLTAKNSVQAKIEGLETGADAYIEKPFNLAYLLAQVHSLLNNRELVKEYFTKSPLTHLKSTSISTQDKAFIQDITNLIYENIDNLDLNVDQLSKLLNLSRPSLYRKIKALSDLTPNELIQVVRLKKAAEILSEGNSRINEVAAMVGYSVQSNFSRDFNKQFGMTPTHFMEGLRVKK